MTSNKLTFHLPVEVWLQVTTLLASIMTSYRMHLPSTPQLRFGSR